MPLTDTAVKNCKPRACGKDLKLSDGGGLHLLVKPNGAKYWRQSYRLNGKQKTLSHGVYPTTSLKDARARRDEVKRLLSKGIDPSLSRKLDKTAKRNAMANSFEAISREWLAKRTPSWAHETATRIFRIFRSFEADLFPFIGHRPISEINAAELLETLRRIENRGAVETAHRVKQRAGEVFRYAIATQRAEHNPVPNLQGALAPSRKNNFAAIKDPSRAGELLRAIDGYQGTAVVKAALALAPLVFVRPGNLRRAEWKELDLETATWTIPADKMKTGQAHIVPLSTQALLILREIQPLTGRNTEYQPYVFPSARAGGRPMSDNAILAALRSLGIPKEEMTGHGFRHMASTMLHEQGWNSDVIERQLAHVEQNSVKGVYNKAKHLAERAKMMQAWADYLDQIRNGDNRE